jgi:two-component system sensor histidine kinase GlrK
MSLTIPKRMLIGSSIVILMVIVVSVFWVMTTHKLNETAEELVFRNNSIRSQAKKLQDLVLSMEESEKKLILLKKPEYREVFAESAHEFESTLRSLEGLIVDSRVANEIERTSGLFETYRYIVQNALSKGGEEGIQKLTSVSHLTEDVGDEIINALDRSLMLNEENIDLSLATLGKEGSEAVRLAVVICSLSIGVGLLGYYYLNRTISRPVRLLERATNRLSKGDFDHLVPIDSKDELGTLARSFNEMAGRLKELDELKSEFVSLLSHELRTPLSVMREAVSLLKDEILGKVEDRQREFLIILSQEVERMIQFVNELLDLSRIEAGRLPVERFPVDIGEIIGNNLKKIRPLLADKKIDAELVIGQHLPMVVADGVRIDQVLSNLLDNAIKFTPEGGRIVISADVADGRSRREDRGTRGKERFVRVRVCDNGEGIEDEDRRYVFDKFYQSKASKVKNPKGSGLGLSISKGIVEAHGGTIWFTSTKGQGTSFYFTLPAEH